MEKSSPQPKKKILVKKKSGKGTPVKAKVSGKNSMAKKKVVIKKNTTDSVAIKKKTGPQPKNPSEPLVAVIAPVEPETPSVTTTVEKRGDVFSFYCPYCSEKVEASTHDTGTEIECGSCKSQVAVPALLSPSDTGKDSPSGKTKVSAFKFYCLSCGQKLSATPAMVGRITKCPTCNNSVTIPHPSESGEPERRNAPAFKFFCSSCNQKLEAQISWVGKKLSCPGCGENITIPSP